MKQSSFDDSPDMQYVEIVGPADFTSIDAAGLRRAGTGTLGLVFIVEAGVLSDVRSARRPLHATLRRA